jgi:proline iminopeptidase
MPPAAPHQPLCPLYPDAALLRRDALSVGNGHVIEVQEHGQAQGIPALVLHGGPGSGSSPWLRRFFDPRRFRIVCVDQRGAGASRPRGAIEHNTTADLIEDLRRVRHELGIEKWLVVGGSWGAALALAYAAEEPGAVAALLLRSSFVARAEDVDWFFHGAAGEAPAAWDRFIAAAAPADRQQLLPRLAATLRDGAAGDRRHVALAWWRWEQALAGSSVAEPEGEQALAALVDRYRVQSHYLVNDCFLAAPTLLQRCERVPKVPTLLLHGRADRICRPQGAAALHQALPGAQLHWIDGAGHDPMHPAMVDAMVRALDRYANETRFWGPVAV